MLYESETVESRTHLRGLNEACGVFGILDANNPKIGQYIYYGLYALQHRGQESCGVAVFQEGTLRVHKDMGLVNQVFTDALVAQLTGQIGVGHTRYSTTGDSSLDNAQPVVTKTPLGPLTVAHNGNLINTDELRDFLQERGYYGFGNSDSHLIAQYINFQLNQGDTLKEAVCKAVQASRGAFSLVVATADTLIAVRDANGLRPFCFGRITHTNGDLAFVVASETCALDIVGATYERDIMPGEIFTLHLDGRQESAFFSDQPKNNLCVFEQVYFARPDSRINNASVYNYRLNLGRRLAEISPQDVEADIVIPVPDSGNVAAVGYSQASGVPYAEGLIKNRYVGRTFINPTQDLRERSIQLKLNPLTDILRGKRVIVVDDSIVRGNTSRKIVKMLKESGVTELHLRISSAQVKHPCFYGIDMSSPDQLIANQMGLEEIRQWLGVDSLVYLSPEDMVALSGNPASCAACFNDVYPAGTPLSPVEIPQPA